MDTNTINKFLLPGSVILAGLFIAGAVMWNGSHPAGQQGGKPAVAVDVKNVKTDGNPFIGNPNAPVTIAFWTDFQCPYCRAVEVGGIPQIPTPPAIPGVIEKYVKTGKVKIVFMNFTFLGEDSTTAAEYSYAVWKLYPELYYTWREAMFAAQDDEGDKGFGDAASIDALNATITGLDAAKIATDVQTNAAAYQARIAADKAEAVKVGINATPSFVVGKQVIAGAYPYAKFEEVIETTLK